MPSPRAVQVGHGEHLAADVAVADKVNEVMAPVDRLHNVRERQADGTDALVVHGESVGRIRQKRDRKGEAKGAAVSLPV